MSAPTLAAFDLRAASGRSHNGSDDMTSNPRNANGHRRRTVRAQVLAEEDDCGICGQPVDKTLPAGLPGSAEVDEIIPVSKGGNPFRRENCRLSHRRCNVLRGNDSRPRSVLVPFRTGRSW